MNFKVEWDKHAMHNGFEVEKSKTSRGNGACLGRQNGVRPKNYLSYSPTKVHFRLGGTVWNLRKVLVKNVFRIKEDNSYGCFLNFFTRKTIVIDRPSPLNIASISQKKEGEKAPPRLDSPAEL